MIFRQKIDILMVFTLILIIISLFWINYSNIDLIIQNQLFDFENKNWLIDSSEPQKKFIFHKFPKILYAIFAALMLFYTILGFKRGLKSRHQFLLIFLGLVLIPLIIGNIKKFTNIYCPAQTVIYGGDKPYITIFDNYPPDFMQQKKGKCFPAGHAITGFALFILAFALTKKSHKILALLSAFILGWIMGFYQMAKGAHFFGDTLITMLACFFMAALIKRIYFALAKL